jgi:hypothetical protein
MHSNAKRAGTKHRGRGGDARVPTVEVRSGHARSIVFRTLNIHGSSFDRQL